MSAVPLRRHYQVLRLVVRRGGRVALRGDILYHSPPVGIVPQNMRIIIAVDRTAIGAPLKAQPRKNDREIPIPLYSAPCSRKRSMCGDSLSEALFFLLTFSLIGLRWLRGARKTLPACGQRVLSAPQALLNGGRSCSVVGMRLAHADHRGGMPARQASGAQAGALGAGGVSALTVGGRVGYNKTRFLRVS